MSRNPELVREFIRQAKAILSLHTEITHSWSIDDDEDHCILEIPKSEDTGFSITVKVSPDSVYIFAGGAHTTLEPETEIPQFVAHTLGLVRDLLCPSMRILEKRSNNSPYRWEIQSFENGKWQTEEEIGLFFWNYLGKKTEVVFQNRRLPVRSQT